MLINHRKCLVSSDKWSIQEASNHRKGMNAQKEGSCFRTSQMSNFAAIMTSSNRRKRASWELMFVRGFQPKAPKLLRVIHCKKSFSNLRQVVIDRDGHTDSSFSSSAETFIILTGHSFIVKLKCYQGARESLEMPINAQFFQQFVISKSCSLVSDKLA
jgi:hypothetical protein